MQRLDTIIPERGQLTQLADDLYWGRFELPFRLNHINLYMIDTDDGWALIDAGLGAEDTQNHWRELLAEPLAKQPVAKIIITHHHVDHLGNAAWLSQETKAPVLASKGEIKQSNWLFGLPEAEFSAIMGRSYSRYGMDQKDIDLVRSGGSRFRKMVPALPVFQTINHGETIKSRAGIWHIRADSGHSHEHISLMDSERGLYLAIDFLLPRISPNIAADISDIDADRLAPYLTYLDEMTQLDDETKIYPGHDWPFKQGGKRAKALIDHHRNRLDLLHDAARKTPLNTHQAMDVLFGKNFGDHELYFASGEARAHLNHLVATQRLTMERRDNKPDLFHHKI